MSIISDSIPSWAHSKVFFWKSSKIGLDYIDASTGEVLAQLEHTGSDSWKYQGIYYSSLEAALKTAVADMNTERAA